MLILTRRKNQKVVFPTLGITVKIVDVSGKTVRLGVDAPKEIRIVRDELEPLDAAAVHSSQRQSPAMEGSVSYENPVNRIAGQNDSSGTDSERVEVLVRQLDAANLALHLAQNQLRQGHNEYADESLQHAIESLQEIEMAAGLIPVEELSAVRESDRGYAVNRKRTALLLSGTPDDRLVVAKRLTDSGMLVSLSPTGKPLDLISAMKRGSQPDLVLMLDAEVGLPNHGDSPEQEPMPAIQLGTLRSLTRTFNVDIGGCLATAWTSGDFCLSELAG